MSNRIFSASVVMGALVAAYGVWNHCRPVASEASKTLSSGAGCRNPQLKPPSRRQRTYTGDRHIRIGDRYSTKKPTAFKAESFSGRAGSKPIGAREKTPPRRCLPNREQRVGLSDDEMNVTLSGISLGIAAGIVGDVPVGTDVACPSQDCISANAIRASSNAVEVPDTLRVTWETCWRAPNGRPSAARATAIATSDFR